MRWVIGSTPLTALTTITAVSTASSALSVRPRKSGYPGVSIMLTRLALRLEAADGGVEGVEQGLLLRIEVADRRATGERPLGPDSAGLREQGFGQQRLARAGLAH